MLSAPGSSILTALVAGGAASMAPRLAARVASGRQRGRLGVPAHRALRLAVPRFIAVAVADAGLAVDPVRVFSGWLAAGLAVVVGGAAIGQPVIGAVVLAVVATVPPAGAKLLAGRLTRRTDAQLPELLDQVARSLRGGASLHLALIDACRGMAPPLRHELERLQGEIRAGAPLVDTLDRWAERAPRRPVRLVVAALASSAESGGAGARAVDGVAASLRASAAVAAEAGALASQARYSALVIALAPLVFAVLAVGADHRTAHFLFETTLGQLCLLGGFSLDVGGLWWMQRIVGSVS
jgi:tight adherence protein B